MYIADMKVQALCCRGCHISTFSYLFFNSLTWRDKILTDPVGQKVDSKETIMDIIRRRKWLLFGHICRMPDDRLIKTVLLGSVDGMRQRGRPRKKWTDNITD